MRDALPRPTLVVSLAVALSLLGDSMLYAVLPARYDDFGLPVIAVGLILSVNRWVRLLTNPLAGRLCDRVGIRLPFLGAVGVGALTTAAYGLAPGLAALVLARLLWGGCWSLLRLGGYLTVLHHSPPDRLARGLGFFYAISRTGSLAGMLAGGLLADTLGPRPTLVLFGAATLLGLPLAGTVPLDWSRSPGPGPRSRPGPRWRLGAGFLLGEEGGDAAGQVAAVHLAALWVALTAATATSTLGLLLRFELGERVDVLGIALGIATVTGMVLAVRWVVDLALVPLCGVLSDRVGRRPAAALFSLVAAVGLLTLAVAPRPALILVGAALAFAGSSALVVVLEAAAGSLAPRAGRSAAMSRYATWSDLGSATGPALGYAIAGTLGLPATYALTALGLAVAIAGFVWATPTASRPAARCRG